MTGILALAGAQGIINFSGGFPEPALLPTDTIGKIAARLVADDPGVALQYTPSQGLASTREAMRDHVEATNGRRPAEDELMVTSGAFDAVALVAQSLVDPGDLVLVEEPTYLGAVAGFVGLGAALGAVPTDEDGLDVDALARMLDDGADTKVLYIIPEHQNPTGRTLAPERRQPLVDLCRQHGLLVLEDVAYRELDFDGSAHPSLWSLAPDVLVQAGTFSKAFSPGVRLGWAAGPAAVVAAMVVAKQNTDQCSGALGQRMVEEYIRGGHFPAQVALEQALYRRRGEAVEAALRRHMPDDVTWTNRKAASSCGSTCLASTPSGWPRRGSSSPWPSCRGRPSSPSGRSTSTCDCPSAAWPTTTSTRGSGASPRRSH